MMARISVLGLAALLAAPLVAQEPGAMGQGTMHAMMQEMMAPMMRGMAFAPDHLLARKDALGLSAQQMARLTAIRDASKAAHDAAHADAKTHIDALAVAMQAAVPDTSVLKLHFQAAHGAMGKAHWTMLTVAAQAKAVLTDEQRGRVNGWVDQMRHSGHDQRP